MIQIQTTSNLKKVLKNIAADLLKQKLAVCTHITKISCSSYIWKDEIVNEKEYKLEIKTIKKHKKNIISIIKENHNYEVFELFVNDVSNVNKDYEKWFKNEIK